MLSPMWFSTPSNRTGKAPNGGSEREFNFTAGNVALANEVDTPIDGVKTEDTASLGGIVTNSVIFVESTSSVPDEEPLTMWGAVKSLYRTVI